MNAQTEFTDTDIAHLAGYVDAVGKITAHVLTNDHYSIDHEFRPLIRLSIDGDAEAMLGKLLGFCDERGIKYGLHQNEESNRYAIEIREAQSIERFLDPLCLHLVEQYETADLMLTEILPRIQTGRHREREGFVELLELSAPIRSAARGGDSWTVADFEEMWDL